MGMFDWVICEAELPDEFVVKDDIYGDGTFQTKDFDNFMDTLKITKDGRLEIFISAWKDEGFGEYHDRHGKLFTGSFNFYTSDEDKWHEYTAYFVNGKLREILIDSRFDPFSNQDQ